MWPPSHAHVLVQRAENLLIKGKNGTNNAFVVIELGKESYRTSVKEKSGKSVTWKEECELKIPASENTVFLILTAFHRNSLGLDEFLGTVKIPIDSSNKTTKRSGWFRLEGKPGKEKGKDKVRGRLEVEIGFVSRVQSQSLTSLQSKVKSSNEHLTGSLSALAQNDARKLKLKTLSSTLQRMGLRKKQKPGDAEFLPVFERVGIANSVSNSASTENCSNLDPGVISDDEDSISRKSSESYCASPESPSETRGSNQTAAQTKTQPPLRKNPEISISFCDDNNKPHFGSDTDMRQSASSSPGKRNKHPKLSEIQIGFADRRLSTSCVDIYTHSDPKPEKKFSSSLQLEINQSDSSKKLSKFAKRLKNLHTVEKKEVKRTVIGCEAGCDKSDEGSISPRSEYRNKNKDELIKMVVDLQKRVNCVSIRVKDLEDYLDEILVKVMDTVPRLLEKS
ncbi:hypothetical protein RUM44_009819 [Polyplax serrata]|uniref:Uncharacterized protein n=1 Tax=Polyplax serrata TaxID=468196 RepID=A0ABR1ATR7_POLSC